MAPAKKVFLTHIFSQGPALRGGASGQGNLSAAGDTFGPTSGALNTIQVGDVLRLTAPDSVAGQAGVIKAVDVGLGLITLYTALAGDGSGLVVNNVTWRAEPPRQADDLTSDVMRTEVLDYLDKKAGQVIIEVANTSRKWEGKFAQRDPVEVWIDDGDAATPAPTFPAHTSDTSNAGEDSGAFSGRVDRIERDTTQAGEVLRLYCRDYTADLLDTPVDAVFLNARMFDAAGNSVAELLQKLYNGVKTASASDLGNEFRAGKCGAMRDRATGRPTFALATSVNGAGTASNPQGDLAFATVPFFDAYGQVAGVCSQQTAGMFQGEPLRFFVDSWTYHPRRADRTGAGEDDPRPNPGANPGAGNPTIVLKTPAEVQGAALAFTINEGTNVPALRPQQDSERTRNTLVLQGVRNDDVPVIVQREQDGSFKDAHGQAVLGRDRYGEMGNVAHARGLFDAVAADALATAALVRTRAAKDRRSINRLMAVVPGRRLSGAVVTVVAPSASLNGLVGIAGVRHSFQASGLVSEFDLTHIRPGWDRLLAPVEKNVRDTLREDVWKGWRVYIMDVDAGLALTFKRVLSHQYGTASKETTLFTVANPPQGTYPTSNGNPWVPAGFRFYNGFIIICWRDTLADGNGKYAMLFQVLDAYTGVPWRSGSADGIYSTMQVGGPILFDTTAASPPTDVWVEAHTNLGADPFVASSLVVWVGSALFTQRFFLARQANNVIRKEAAVGLPGLGANSVAARFFIEERDDGHLIYHTVFRETAAVVGSKTKWAVYDITAAGPAYEFQETLDDALMAHSITGDRSGEASVYVMGDRSDPFTPMFLKFTMRWGANGWERNVTQVARNLSVRSDGVENSVMGRVDIVPFTFFRFVSD